GILQTADHRWRCLDQPSKLLLRITCFNSKIIDLLSYLKIHTLICHHLLKLWIAGQIPPPEDLSTISITLGSGCLPIHQLRFHSSYVYLPGSTRNWALYRFARLICCLSTEASVLVKPCVMTTSPFPWKKNVMRYCTLMYLSLSS